MAKKRKFNPYGFEKKGSSNLSATLYASMLQSPAWYALSPKAKELFVYMKLQLYGQAPIEGYGADCFVFNQAMYSKVYPLYKSGAQFRRDRDQLIKYGFIEIVECGRFTRTKNIYRFSAKWQEIKN